MTSILRLVEDARNLKAEISAAAKRLDANPAPKPPAEGQFDQPFHDAMARRLSIGLEINSLGNKMDAVKEQIANYFINNLPTNIDFGFDDDKTLIFFYGNRFTIEPNDAEDVVDATIETNFPTINEERGWDDDAGFTETFTVQMHHNLDPEIHPDPNLPSVQPQMLADGKMGHIGDAVEVNEYCVASGIALTIGTRGIISEFHPHDTRPTAWIDLTPTANPTLVEVPTSKLRTTSKFFN